MPAFSYNGNVAFGFRVDDIEVASEGLKKADCKLFVEINRVPEIAYTYCHVKEPYGLNEKNRSNIINKNYGIEREQRWLFPFFMVRIVRN